MTEASANDVSEAADVRLICIDQLTPGPWCRPLVASWVRTLVADAESLPPIIVAVHEGATVVVDGMHRVAAARQLGRTHLLARDLPAATTGECWLVAARANLAPGLVWDVAQRHRAAQALVALNPGMSARSIAQLCTVSASTVDRIKRQIAASTASTTQLPIATRGLDGRTRPTPSEAARKRRVIRREIRRQPGATDTAIARLVPCSRATVTRTRASMPDARLRRALRRAWRGVCTTWAAGLQRVRSNSVPSWGHRTGTSQSTTADLPSGSER